MIVCHWPSRLTVLRPSMLAMSPVCCACTAGTTKNKRIRNRMDFIFRLRQILVNYRYPNSLALVLDDSKPFNLAERRRGKRLVPGQAGKTGPETVKTHGRHFSCALAPGSSPVHPTLAASA